MTQEELDDIVLSLADKGVDRAVTVAALRRQGDPKAGELEESQIMFSNVMNSLRDYDIDSTLLSQDDINYCIELATIITQTKP